LESFSFSGKNILVTGASGGLGSTLVKGMAEMGASLVISARTSSRLKQLISTLPKQTRTIPVPADLASPDSAKNLAERAIKALGHIDVLLNNAGIGYFALMEEAAEQKIRHLFEVNTFSPLALIIALLPHMKTRKSGRIINIVSCAGRVPVPTEGVYGGSKTALAVMCNTMRLELEPLGIDVINIYPGTVDTRFEENALRENKRPGLRPADHFGASAASISKEILAAAAGPPGEIWLDKGARWLAAASLSWPKFADGRLYALRDKVLSHVPQTIPFENRPWRLLSFETSAVSQLKCADGFWKSAHRQTKTALPQSKKIWKAVRSSLPEIQTIDFITGQPPLEQHPLADWIKQAKSVGCQTGVQADPAALSNGIARQIIQSGTDRMIFLMRSVPTENDGGIAAGTEFETICERIMSVNSLRSGYGTTMIIDFLLSLKNIELIEDMVELAARLGADRVHFSQCDVIQGAFKKDRGFLYAKDSLGKKGVTKALARARRRAKKVKIDLTSFSQAPEEQPVCELDPRHSLIIRHDGTVAPCVNLAVGGPVFFLGRKVDMPTVHYGRLPEQSLAELWENESCRFFRNRFQDRIRAHDAKLGIRAFEASWPKLQEALRAARDAMPPPPRGCDVCAYLYDI